MSTPTISAKAAAIEAEVSSVTGTGLPTGGIWQLLLSLLTAFLGGCGTGVPTPAPAAAARARKPRLLDGIRIRRFAKQNGMGHVSEEVVAAVLDAGSEVTDADMQAMMDEASQNAPQATKKP